MPCDGAGGPRLTCLSAGISGSLISLITFCSLKSTTTNPFMPPNWEKIHLVEPSGLVEIAIGEGAGFMTNRQATSLVAVSMTFIRLAGGLAPRLDPAITYFP